MKAITKPTPEQLKAAAGAMYAALKAVEAHHVKLNHAAGRDEERSTTLKLARSGLDAVERLRA